MTVHKTDPALYLAKLDFFLPLLKIVDLAKAGVEVTILLAGKHKIRPLTTISSHQHPTDVDAYLGTIKSLTTVESLQPPTPRRNDYFQHLLSTIFSVFQIPAHLIKFVSASSFQYSQKYNEDLHVLSALTEEFEARDVQFPPSQGVEPPANLALRSLMSPIFQTLDQVNLKADLRIGTVAQVCRFGLFQLRSANLFSGTLAFDLRIFFPLAS